MSFQVLLESSPSIRKMKQKSNKSFTRCRVRSILNDESVESHNEKNRQEETKIKKTHKNSRAFIQRYEAGRINLRIPVSQPQQTPNRT